MPDEDNIRIICLGDFDTTKAVHEARSLLKKYGGIAVPGNHDEMIFDQHVDFFSGTFGPGRTPFTCIQEFSKDKIARTYLEHLIYGESEKLKLLELLSEKEKKHTPQDRLNAQIRLLPIHSVSETASHNNAAVVHGGFAGQASSIGAYSGEEHGRLWYRIYDGNGVLSDSYAEQNFEKMKELGVNILIRGHDHVQSYAYKRQNNSIDARSGRVSGYNLLPARMHIINPGAYYDGEYAIIDTDFFVPRLSFHKLK